MNDGRWDEIGARVLTPIYAKIGCTFDALAPLPEFRDFGDHTFLFIFSEINGPEFKMWLDASNSKYEFLGEDFRVWGFRFPNDSSFLDEIKSQFDTAKWTIDNERFRVKEGHIIAEVDAFVSTLTPDQSLGLGRLLKLDTYDLSQYLCAALEKRLGEDFFDRNEE